MTDSDLELEPPTSGDKKFPLPPAGPVAAIICDVVNLGSRIKQWQNDEPRIVPMVAIVFRIHELREDGTPFELAARYTKSIGEKSKLRRVLGDLRGKPLAKDEKVDLGKLPNTACMISIVHSVSKQGKTYADIGTVMPLPKKTIAPRLVNYTRAPYWADVKAKYAAEVAAFEATQRGPEPGDANEEWEPA